MLAAFNGPSMQKFGAKITSRSVVVPIVYALVMIVGFALVYGFIGYNKHFETTEDNKNRNWENAFAASMYCQSGAMGPVTAKTHLGEVLMALQTAAGWIYFLVIVSMI
jgi:hypothetical protein